ncbi:flippase [Oceanimonas marisflavi]|uniref:flippase n=1 Tax=Oceanimonas marisflavi TaxID=2059724 RepID=UPI000D31D67D|nr:flippase [Oceanimonas marisflavi]
MNGLVTDARTRKNNNLNIKSPLIKSFLGLGALRILSIPLGLLTSVILARGLGTEGFGQYSFVMSLIAIIALPVAGGVPQLFTREVAGYLHNKQWGLYRGVLRAGHMWVVVSSLVILGGYFFVSNITHWLPADDKWQLLGIAVLMIPFLGLGAVRDGSIKGLGKPVYAELPGQFLQPVLLIASYFVLLKLDILTTQTVIWGQVLVACLVFLCASALFYRLQSSHRRQQPPEYQAAQWGRALLPFTLLALVGTLNAQIGIIVLGFLGTDEQVAAMRVADRGAQFVALSLTLVNLVIAPHIVRAYRSKNKEQLQTLARQSARGSFAIALPIGLVLLFAGKPLLGWVFGKEYASSAYYPMAILVVGQLINVFFGSVGYLLSMSGYEKDTLRGHGSSVTLNVILSFILIPLLGAEGAALSASLSIFSWNFVLSFFVLKRLGIKPSCI